MDLLDSYIRILRVFLPKNQRDDIVRELSEEMRSQAADREAALGRPLDADEQASLLSQYGHPMLTAVRYRPLRHLIGPAVFPYYALVLKAALGLLLAGHAIGLMAVLAQGASPPQLGERITALIRNIFAVGAWLTLLGAIVDWWLAKWHVLERWDPKRLLPRLPQRQGGAPSRPIAGPTSISRFVLALVPSGLWLLALRYPYLMLGPGAVALDWGPAMHRLYPVLAAVLITSLVEHFARLTRPHAAWLFRVTGVVWTFAALFFLYLILTVDHQWVAWRDAVDTAARAKVQVEIAGRHLSIIDLTNYVFAIAFTLAAVGCALTAVRRLRRSSSGGGWLGAVAVLVAAIAQAAPQIPDDPTIRQILVDRIETGRRSVGIVVGIVTPNGRRIISHGRFSVNDARPVDSDTVFEIGSVTKLFTSLLLADMDRRGELSVTDPLTRHLPPVMTGSPRKAVTLTDLATHTSGLPFWPSNIPATDEGAAAMATYSADQLLRFAATFEPPPDAGSKWAYSNTGAGILGAVLARRSGSSYEKLVQHRVTGPLRMTSTAVMPSPLMRSRLAQGHDAQLAPAPRWDVPALPGAGSLHSTVSDLLTFLAAAGDGSSVVARAMPTMLHTRRQAPGFQQAIGWMIVSTGPEDEGFLLHDGQTRGFASSVVYDPRQRTGVVVLSNSADSVSDVARHLLRPAMPLSKPAPQKSEIRIDRRLFDRYAGRYAAGSDAFFIVTVEDDALMLQLPELPKLRLRPESEREFFIAEDTRVSVTFDVNAQGEVTRLLLRSPEGDSPATRVGIGR